MPSNNPLYCRATYNIHLGWAMHEDPLRLLLGGKSVHVKHARFLGTLKRILSLKESN
jgi:hypothetical protein